VRRSRGAGSGTQRHEHDQRDGRRASGEPSEEHENLLGLERASAARGLLTKGLTYAADHKSDRALVSRPAQAPPRPTWRVRLAPKSPWLGWAEAGLPGGGDLVGALSRTETTTLLPRLTSDNSHQAAPRHR